MEILNPSDRLAGAVLIIHSWWGLTDSFRRYGASLAASGFLSGLADLFEGDVAANTVQAKALRARPRRLPMYKTLAADIENLRSAAGGETLKVGVVGFSMGGHWAVWLSQRPEYQVAATILYYVARGGSFDKCEASILAHFADEDEWMHASARSYRVVRELPGLLNGATMAKSLGLLAIQPALSSVGVAVGCCHFLGW